MNMSPILLIVKESTYEIRIVTNCGLQHSDEGSHIRAHGLRTPNEGINQRNFKILGRCGRQNMLRTYLKIWEWE